MGSVGVCGSETGGDPERLLFSVCIPIMLFLRRRLNTPLARDEEVEDDCAEIDGACVVCEKVGASPLGLWDMVVVELRRGDATESTTSPSSGVMNAELKADSSESNVEARTLRSQLDVWR